MTSTTQSVTTQRGQVNNLQIAWLIAKHQIVEGLRNRSNLIMAIFFIAFPVLMLEISLRPAMSHYTPADAPIAGAFATLILLMAGMMSSTSAIIVGANAFAGEKEQGSLTPLLATPASNETIFFGKILGAILPTFVYSAISVIAYLVAFVLSFGADKLQIFPAGVTWFVILLIPTASLLAAVLVICISSRVRTSQAAQSYASLIQIAILFGVLGLSFKISDWGSWIMVATIVGLVLIDALLIFFGAATWRREEVMAQR